MALLLTNPDGSYAGECAICKRPLTDPVFATTHFIADSSDRLYEFSDAAMHWNCYAGWKYQRRFAQQYFDAVCAWKPKNPYSPIVAKTDDFLISANPNLDEPAAHIDIRSVGPGFRVPIRDWTQWINGGWNLSCVHDLERSAMIEIEESVRRIVPNSETVLALANQNLKAAQ